MGFVTENDLTDGISGRVGNKIVFRVVKGRTLVTRRPKRTAAPTELQLQHRERFQQAARYAKEKMLDPAAKAVYDQIAEGQAYNSAFSEAVRDYLTLPKVVGVNVGAYSGAAGSVLGVKVSDNVKVITLNVSIRDASNNVIESGNASHTPGDMEWKYTTTTAIPSLSGVKIIVTAIDRPGNQATFEQLL